MPTLDGAGEGTPQQVAGEGACVLAVAQEDLAVDDGGGDAAAALDEPAGPRGVPLGPPRGPCLV